MFGQSLLSAFGIACTTDTDQLFGTDVTATSIATYQLNASPVTSIPGNNYPGTASNITFAAGKFGNAAVFNGSNSKIIANGKPLNNNTSITISFWARNINSSDWKTLLGEGGDSGNTPGYKIYTSPPSVANSNYLWIARADNSGYVFDTYDSSAANKGGVDMSVAGSAWVHCVFTVSPTQLIIYKNGVSVKSLSISNTSSVVGYYDFQFMYDTKYNRYLQGELDQVRLFDTTLSQAAVTALYNETTTTATSASIDYVDANPNSIAYYKMSDATDQLGNYNGTATNVNFNTEGKFGFAGAFNGSSGSGMLLPAGINKNNNFSWSFWVKFNSFTLYDTLVGFFTDGYTNYLDVRGISGNNAYLNMYDGNSGLTTPANSISIGSWYHVAFTKSSTTGRKIYINGSEVASNSSTSNSGSSSAGRNFLGAYSSSGNPTTALLNLDGKLDQIRIYDSALSAANVTTLYKEVECSPAAINALDQFNTVLYTGNGGTQAVTGVGFKPDFSWVKNRNTNGNSHELADVIRGVDNTINSNSANGEYNNATYQFNSFDADGITVTDDAAGNYAVNGNNETYVAWNWKAPLANLSTGFNGSSTVGSASKIDLTGSTTLTTRSISLWVNLAGTGSGGNLILDNSDGQNPGVVQYGKWVIQLQYGGTNYFCWDTYTGGSYGICDVNYTFNLNTWYHIVFVAEANNQAVYINGVSQTLQNVSRAGDIGTVTMSTNRLGASWSTQYTHALNGKMGQVRIFNDALTANEVADLYTEPAASNNTLNYPAGAGCIAAYPLQTDAIDLSGNYSGASSNVTFGQPGYLTGNTDGTIPTAVAVNKEAGFSIAVSASVSNVVETFGHGLSVVPELILLKTIDSSQNWLVYTASTGTGRFLNLNTSNALSAAGAYPDIFKSVSNTTIETKFDAADTRLVFYCFASIPGYSKIGSYVGNGSSNPIYVGFQPKFVMAKQTTGSGSWLIMDSTRGANKQLYPNLNSAEYSDTGNSFSSTGFTMKSNGNWNNSGQTYIYLAIA